MNLYWVTEEGAEWVVFVFAQTRNKARSMLHADDKGVEYITTRARLIGKTEEVKQETLVDTERHPLYWIVKKLGWTFTDLEGDEI